VTDKAGQEQLSPGGLLVRRYLAVHFHLRHSDLGIVPLLSTPPQWSGEESWDGAAIMLLKANVKK
jgi:hypothetical protein